MEGGGAGVLAVNRCEVVCSYHTEAGIAMVVGYTESSIASSLHVTSGSWAAPEFFTWGRRRGGGASESGMRADSRQTTGTLAFTVR